MSNYLQMDVCGTESLSGMFAVTGIFKNKGEHSNIGCSGYSKVEQSWEAAQHCSFDCADLVSVSLID